MNRRNIESPEYGEALRKMSIKMKEDNRRKRILGARLQRLALIEPLVTKKKKGRIIKKVAPRIAMKTAKIASVDEIVKSFIEYTKANPDWKTKNGTFDPISKTIVDASNIEGARKLQATYKPTGSIGLNSVTDTRRAPVYDIEQIRREGKEKIESLGHHFTIGVWNGSLEATKVLLNKTDEEVIGDLGEEQRATYIVYKDGSSKEHLNPNFKNLTNKL